MIEFKNNTNEHDFDLIMWNETIQKSLFVKMQSDCMTIVETKSSPFPRFSVKQVHPLVVASLFWDIAIDEKWHLVRYNLEIFKKMVDLCLFEDKDHAFECLLGLHDRFVKGMSYQVVAEAEKILLNAIKETKSNASL